MKLNLGCGTNKLEGFINIDCDSSLNPDQVINFCHGLPFGSNTVSHIVMYHTIEHIPKRFWGFIFSEINKVLMPDGQFWLSFPEFRKCVKNWGENYKGIKDFWENTIYGRQLTASDFHVSIADSTEIKHLLVKLGFEIVYLGPEPEQDHNTIIKCKKIRPPIQYEETVKEVVWGN